MASKIECLVDQTDLFSTLFLSGNMYRETKKYTLRNIALLNPVCFVRITIVFFSKVDMLITNLLY